MKKTKQDYSIEILQLQIAILRSGYDLDRNYNIKTWGSPMRYTKKAMQDKVRQLKRFISRNFVMI